MNRATFCFCAPVTEDAVAVNWDNAEAAEITASELETAPADGATYLPLPAAAAKPKNLATSSKAFALWLYHSQTLELHRSPSTGEISESGETERDFRIRVQQAAREERDRIAKSLKRRYGPKLALLEERKRRAEQAVEREKEQSQGAVLQTAFSVGSGLPGAFLRRKTLSAALAGPWAPHGRPAANVKNRPTSAARRKPSKPPSSRSTSSARSFRLRRPRNKPRSTRPPSPSNR